MGFGNVWYPMFGVVCYVLSPLPIVIGGFLAQKNPLNHNEGRGFMEAGIFLSSFFLVSGLALPMVGKDPLRGLPQSNENPRRAVNWTGFAPRDLPRPADGHTRFLLLLLLLL